MWVGTQPRALGLRTARRADCQSMGSHSASQIGNPSADPCRKKLPTGTVDEPSHAQTDRSGTRTPTRLRLRACNPGFIPVSFRSMAQVPVCHAAGFDVRTSAIRTVGGFASDHPSRPAFRTGPSLRRPPGLLEVRSQASLSPRLDSTMIASEVGKIHWSLSASKDFAVRSRLTSGGSLRRSSRGPAELLGGAPPISQWEFSAGLSASLRAVA